MNVEVVEDAAVEIVPAWSLLQPLIEQQGVTPVADLNELSALWPVNDDPDELLAFILTARAMRCSPRPVVEKGLFA